jgi:thiol-disulfide isomerase/thioredoxin
MIMSTPTHLPALEGAAGWLNSPPLRPAELRGHVTVVNFWTLTCINWLRQEPYVRAWSRAYRDDGLVVIGVHTPEFFFERDVELVRQATAEREIDYPVAVDSHYAIWNAFDNHYWPALYFIDADGVIVGQHFGEGEYEQSEHVIQRLLGIDREPVAPAVHGQGVEAAADWDHLRSPETYLGDGRSEGFASPGGVVAESRLYRIPDSLPLNQWAVAGHWTIEQEKATLDHADGRIAYRFQARDANLVMSAGEASPIPFRVLVDGQVPGASHGADTDADGNGLLDRGRCYQLVREAGEVLERTLEITFGQPGAQAYVFTFG